MRQEGPYNELVNTLRHVRNSNRKRFMELSLKMAEVLDQLKSSEIPYSSEVPIIKYKDLKSFTKGIWFNVDNNISIRLEDACDNSLKFNVILKAGGKFALKKHDSMHSIRINEGKLIDLTRKTEHSKGEEVIYLEYEPHEHASDIYSEYTINFNSPK